MNEMMQWLAILALFSWALMNSPKKARRWKGWDGGVDHKLDAILRLLRESKRREIAMSLEMDDLEVAVTENVTLDGSILELAQQIADAIAADAGDKTKMLALAASLRAKSAEISAWVTANTPSQPPA